LAEHEAFAFAGLRNKGHGQQYIRHDYSGIRLRKIYGMKNEQPRLQVIIFYDNLKPGLLK
jgi:hypothetical protein